MFILRAGLYLSVAVAALTTWWATEGGYPIEVAMLRGLLAFMATATVAYLAELVVMTAPPARHADERREGAGHDADDDETNEDEERAPVRLPAVRAERDAAADSRRAA